MTIQDDFKADIEAFLTRHDMKPAVFGTQALKDPKFVFDLREGRSPSLKTIDKVRAWIEAYEGGHAESEPSTAWPAASGGAKASVAPTAEEPATTEPAPKAEPARKSPGAAWPQDQTHKPATDKPKRNHNLLFAVLAAGVVLLGLVVVLGPGRLYHYAGRIVSGGQTSQSNDLLLRQFQAVTNAMQGDFNHMSQRLDRLEAQVDGLSENAPSTAGGSADTSELKSALDALTDRVAALEAQGAKPAAPVEDTATKDQLSALQSDTAANRTAIEALKTQAAQLDDWQAKLAAAQAEIASLKDEVASLKGGLGQLESGIGGVGGLKADIERSTAVAAFLRLDSDVRAGRPYQSALALYEKQQAANPDALPSAEALNAHAGTGVASAETLTTDFEALEPKLLEPLEEGGSWSERLMSRLKSIVVIHKTGEVSGDSADAIVARTEMAIKSGDIDKALMELKALSPDRQALAADWAKRAEARRDALKALSDMATALSTEGS